MTLVPSTKTFAVLLRILIVGGLLARRFCQPFSSVKEVGVLVVKGGESAEATNKPKSNDKTLTLAPHLPFCSRSFMSKVC